MKWFVDTADDADIKALAATGLIGDVATNRSLVAKSGRQVACRVGRGRGRSPAG